MRVLVCLTVLLMLVMARRETCDVLKSMKDRKFHLPGKVYYVEGSDNDLVAEALTCDVEKIGMVDVDGFTVTMRDSRLDCRGKAEWVNSLGMKWPYTISFHYFLHEFSFDTRNLNGPTSMDALCGELHLKSLGFLPSAISDEYRDGLRGELSLSATEMRLSSGLSFVETFRHSCIMGATQ